MKDGRRNHYAEAHRGDGPEFICYSEEVEPSQAGPEWTGDWETEVSRLKEQLAIRGKALAASIRLIGRKKEQLAEAEAGAAAMRSGLTKALDNYGDHERDCAKRHGFACTCGFTNWGKVNQKVLATDIGATTLARIERMEKALEFYSNPENWKQTWYLVDESACSTKMNTKWPICEDAGKRAREALKEVPHE